MISRIFSLVVVGGLALLLGACGIMQRAQMQKRNEELAAQSSAAMQQCNERYPAGEAKTALSRAKCQVDALNIRRPSFTYPDLFDFSPRLVW